jgi:hypothetical protein
MSLNQMMMFAKSLQNKSLKYEKMNSREFNVHITSVPTIDKIISTSFSCLKLYLMHNKNTLIKFYIYEDGCILYNIENSRYKVEIHEHTNNFKQLMFKFFTGNRIHCYKKIYSVIKNSNDEIVATISLKLLTKNINIKCFKDYHWKEVQLQ